MRNTDSDRARCMPEVAAEVLDNHLNLHKCTGRYSHIECCQAPDCRIDCRIGYHTGCCKVDSGTVVLDTADRGSESSAQWSWAGRCDDDYIRRGTGRRRTRTVRKG